MPSMTSTVATALGHSEIVGTTTIIATIADGGGIVGIIAIAITIVGLGVAIVTIGTTTATVEVLKS
jgi:hypothetical protein